MKKLVIKNSEELKKANLTKESPYYSSDHVEVLPHDGENPSIFSKLKTSWQKKKDNITSRTATLHNQKSTNLEESLEDFDMTKKNSAKNIFRKFFASWNVKELKKPKQWWQKLPKKNKYILAGTFIFLVVFSYLTYYFISPISSLKAKAHEIEAEVSQLSTEISQKDLTKMETHLKNISDDLDEVAILTKRYKIFESLGIGKGYFHNLEVVRELTVQSSALIKKATPKLKTLLVSMQYKVEEDNTSYDWDIDDSSESESSEEEGIVSMKSVMSSLPEISDFYTEIEGDIFGLLKTFNRLDEKHIPEFIPGNIPEKLVETRKMEGDFDSM